MCSITYIVLGSTQVRKDNWTLQGEKLTPQSTAYFGLTHGSGHKMPVQKDDNRVADFCTLGDGIVVFFHGYFVPATIRLKGQNMSWAKGLRVKKIHNFLCNIYVQQIPFPNFYLRTELRPLQICINLMNYCRCCSLSTFLQIYDITQDVVLKIKANQCFYSIV